MAQRTTSGIDTVPAATARRLLLGAQGLLADPTRRATPAAVRKQISAMGFVQVDTINIVLRAHHHILLTRFDGYQDKHLTRLIERDRTLFEHWTHDASVVPTKWLAPWTVRFSRYEARGPGSNTWWAERFGGDPETAIAHVLERVHEEGPLMSKDFAHDGEKGPWWAWKPQKAALEYLWRCGRLTVARRVNFHKVYDLTERVFPQIDELSAPLPEEHVDWACQSAMERLGVATSGELAAFFAAINSADARQWCEAAVTDGRIVPVLVEAADGSKPRRAFAIPDWTRRATRGADAPDRLRLLSPFDPVLRDRKRSLRLFNFDYRFEAFVPAAKRRWGYYVMPLLQGDTIVGRLDAKLHRDRGLFEVLGLWWEDGIRVTRARRAALHDALERFTDALGAETFTIPS